MSQLLLFNKGIKYIYIKKYVTVTAALWEKMIFIYVYVLWGLVFYISGSSKYLLCGIKKENLRSEHDRDKRNSNTKEKDVILLIS